MMTENFVVHKNAEVELSKAAGSVVNKDIPANCLAGGVPAKILKYNVAWK